MKSTDLQKLAENVARSFSLTLKGVPKAQRESITLTYLLARLADTISDSGTWSTADRLLHLERFEASIYGSTYKSWRLTHNVGGFKSSEAELILAADQLIVWFHALSEPQRICGQEVLKTLISAMKWDLKTFGDLTIPKYGVKDMMTFDWYCYSIAGCVGAYWVKIFNLPQDLENLAIAYGKGLQRINILRDAVSDFKINRVYLPASELQKFGLHLDSPFWTQSGWGPFVAEYIRETRKLLSYGANFCDALPYRPLRLRWASALPLQIGWKTLDQIETQKDWTRPQKISRKHIKNLVFSSLFEVVFKRSYSKKYR